MAAALATAPILAHAVPTDIESSNRVVNSPKPESTPKTSQSMTKSIKAISALISEKAPEKQVKLFSSLVKPRLIYATARSLCGREDVWLAFVDIYQNYSNGKPTDFKLQQATVQYGLQKLPDKCGQRHAFNRRERITSWSTTSSMCSVSRCMSSAKDALTGDVDGDRQIRESHPFGAHGAGIPRKGSRRR